MGGWCGYRETRMIRFFWRDFSLPFLLWGMLNHHFVKQADSYYDNSIYDLCVQTLDIRRCCECYDSFNEWGRFLQQTSLIFVTYPSRRWLGSRLLRPTSSYWFRFFGWQITALFGWFCGENDCCGPRRIFSFSIFMNECSFKFLHVVWLYIPVGTKKEIKIQYWLECSQKASVKTCHEFLVGFQDELHWWLFPNEWKTPIARVGLLELWEVKRCRSCWWGDDYMNMIRRKRRNREI